MENLNKLIVEAIERKPQSMKETFSKAIAEKVLEAIDNKKMDVADSFLALLDRDKIVDTFEDDLGIDEAKEEDDDMEDDESEQEDQEDDDDEEEDDEEMDDEEEDDKMKKA